MKLLTSIHPEDVDPQVTTLDYSSFKTRQAGRAIIIDPESDNVCLIYVSNHAYYMLPGGGIKEDEDISSALAREIMEEVGCKATIFDEVGSIEVFFDRWQQRQVDFCYAMQKAGKKQDIAATDFEKSEGHKVVWADNISVAIKLMKDAEPEMLDGKMIKARDLLFLNTLAEKMQGTAFLKSFSKAS